MHKTAIFILMITVLICLIPVFNLKAQKYSGSQAFDRDIYEWLAKVEGRIDKLSLDSDATNKQILEKLNLILSNQAEIKEELNIIKVRSTQR